MSNPPKLIIYIQPWETFFRGKVTALHYRPGQVYPVHSGIWLQEHRKRRRALWILVLVGCVFSSIDGYADGDDYFQPTNLPLNQQLIFVGVVKDEAGGYLQGALVRWTATGTASVDGEDYTSSAGSWTDLLGRFRSVDVARVLAIEGIKVDPARVEVTVEKPGYEVVRRLKRSRPR